jgi:DNA (cytosine-5)-methyltransferase 1
MRVVDLFAGCGGLSLGFQNAGFNIIAAIDNWDPAIEVYKANLSHPIYKQDLTDVERTIAQISSMKPEVIIGGPPCQDFSHAGKRTERSRANLTSSFAEIVRSLSPKWFVMENVARAYTSTAFLEAKKIFRDAGYGLTVAILDASLCGVPQKRKRLVCIGRLNEQDDFLEVGIRDRLSRRSMTVRDYFGNDLATEHYYRHPRNYSRRAIYSIDEPAATIRGVNRPIPLGYKKHPADAVDPGISRPLTTIERARIQTFPANYRWLGTKTAKEQMIGNAVPVKLAEFVAGCIASYESGTICSRKTFQLPLRSGDEFPNPGYREVHDVAEKVACAG